MTETAATATIAFDRASSRVFDADGHLHVKRTPISKANVCDYLGSEIPDHAELGLDPTKIYALLRDPDELARAVDTFNGKPLLYDHVPVSADDHDHLGTVGALSGAFWDAPYLYADLSCWSGPAIRTIQDGSKKELSSAYRYRADMTPGTYEGRRYDGVMRDIVGNHVSLVRKGRAGSDVVVGDSMENLIMAKTALSGAAAQTQGALAVYLRPKLAQDKSVDFGPIVGDVTKRNFKASIPGIVLGVHKAVRGKLAQDADVSELAEIVEALVPLVEQLEEPEAVAVVDPDEVDETAKDDDDAQLRALLKAKGLSDEEIERICGGAPVAALDDAEKADANKKAMDAAIQSATKGMVSKTAMDAAISAEVAKARQETTAHLNAIEDARRVVRPWVGDLAMSFDSAEAVVRHSLGMLGRNVAGKHADALIDILESCPKPNERPAPTRLAQDSAGAKTFAERFPGSARIGQAA